MNHDIILDEEKQMGGCNQHTQIKFTKIQGLGNDYLFIEDFDNNIKDPTKLSRNMSERHFGVGDGIILFKKSDAAKLSKF